VACKAVFLAGVDLSRHQDAPNEASMQTAPSRATRVQSIKLLRKIHRLEVEYEILKDLNHVRCLVIWPRYGTDSEQPNIIDMRKVFITTHHMSVLLTES
jgi:hypothetical protein